MYAVNALGSFPMLVGGTEEQKKTWLPKIASGEKLIAFGLSEKYAGSDAQGMRLAATPDGSDGYVLNGEKKWTTNGGAADLYTVFAVTRPGLEVAAHLGVHRREGRRPASRSARSRTRWASAACPSSRPHFEDCRVPEIAAPGRRARVSASSTR